MSRLYRAALFMPQVFKRVPIHRLLILLFGGTTGTYMGTSSDTDTILRRILRNRYAAVGAVMLVSSMGALILKLAGLPVPVLVYLPAVVISALRWGMGPASVATISSVILYGLFFFPFARISWDATSYIVYYAQVLVAFGIVAAAVSHFHQNADDLRDRVHIKTLLLALSHKVTATRGIEELARTAVLTIREVLEAEAVLLTPKAGRLVASAYSSPEIGQLVNDPVQSELATRAWQTGEGTGTISAAPGAILFFPLLSGGRTTGVLGIRPAGNTWLYDPKRRVFVEILTAMIAAAMEREAFAKEAAEANAARRHEELYTALLSSISHDFRTPLASIIGASETLSLPGAIFSEETRKDILSMIREEAERLNRFVGNLLDMTKLEAGHLNLNLERIEVVDIIGTALHRLKRTLEGRRTIVDIEPRLPMIRADFVLIEHVLTNLMENAIKYSPADRPIRIHVHQHGGESVISVIDEGKGIPTEEQEKIFEKFHRVQQGDIRSAGTGLGLSICKGIVEAHGGKIYAVSPVTEGRGTMISFSLPIAGAAEAGVESGVLASDRI